MIPGTRFKLAWFTTAHTFRTGPELVTTLEAKKHNCRMTAIDERTVKIELLNPAAAFKTHYVDQSWAQWVEEDAAEIKEPAGAPWPNHESLEPVKRGPGRPRKELSPEPERSSGQ